MRICIPLILILLVTILQGCAQSNPGRLISEGETANQSDNEVDKIGKIKVVTTIFPQYDFVRQIAGDKVDLKMLLKPGEESHSYEPTPQDIIAIQNCDLFIYVGGENDEWVEEILESLDVKKLETLRLVDCVDTVEEKHVDGMKEEKATHTGEEGFDEHVWTSPGNAIKIVEKISEILCQLDGINAASFKTSTKTYEEKLKLLDLEFQQAVDESKGHIILFGDRFPFRYFADAYGLEYYAAFPGKCL